MSYWRPSYWRRPGRTLVPLAALGVALSASSFAYADLVRITSINGNYDPNHETMVTVRPGDVVQLSADLFPISQDGASYSPQNRNVEEFTWRADDRYDDECDASRGIDCLGTTNFEVTDYGVNFYVPYQAGQEIRITVHHQSAFSSEDADSIVLNNLGAQNNYAPPVEVITQPSDYNYPTFDSDYALGGHGRWVYIGGSRYWVPYSYRAGWQPYQNGYWTWTEHGWTWVSYDPWGWYTDHYGSWRHHGAYGWIWLPFSHHQYRPHTVTWIYGDGYIGWYPYYDGYRDGYRHGHAEGFNDGYWDGYNAGRCYSSGDCGYHHGMTMVHMGSFGHRNIWDVRVDVSISHGWFRDSFHRNAYGMHPGASDMHGSRVWVESRLGRPMPQTRMDVRRFGDVEFHSAVPVNDVPDFYRQLPRQSGERFQRPIPVGSIVQPGAGQSRPVIVPPMSNGRGIGVPPRVIDPNTGNLRPLPPRTTRPGIPSDQNPVYRPVNPPVTPQPGPMPTYRPQPQPRPTFNPQPRPTFEPRPQPTVVPQPQPRPTFNPQPRPTFEPRPQPTVVPQPQPRPTFNPQPRPTFEPRPQPTVVPQPQPRPTFNPQPRPTFEPRPQPRPTFNPQPQPRPTVAPRPQPQPRPTFNPQPQPRPTVAPRPQPPSRPAPSRPSLPGGGARPRPR